MKKESVERCVDSGGPYCPCHLAYSGDCIRCGMLNSRNTCDCMWQGTCIYNEVKKAEYEKTSYGERKEYLCRVLEKTEIEKNLYILKIQLPSELCSKLIEPGSFVLLKSRKNQGFNAPISVMDVDTYKNILYVVIKSVGVKTKDIVANEMIYVKGGYFSGILGVREIKMVEKTNCMVVLNGLSQVNSLNVIKRLIENNNNVKVYINKGATVLDYVIDKIKKMNCEIEYIDLKKDMDFIKDYIIRKNVSLVYCGASVSVSQEIMDIIDDIDENIKLCISNNNLICCGEGLCGACRVNVCGNSIKMCKTQVDAKKYLKSL